jgi:long-chain acyl-CoA synthetase
LRFGEEEDIVIGTVGPLVDHTEVRIADLESGKTLYPNSELPDNGAVFEGRNSCERPSGDERILPRQGTDRPKPSRTAGCEPAILGMITYNDCLKILGRSKSTVVLLSGENLEPEPIEMRLTQSVYIEHCMIVGQDKNMLEL